MEILNRRVLRPDGGTEGLVTIYIPAPKRGGGQEDVPASKQGEGQATVPNTGKRGT